MTHRRFFCLVLILGLVFSLVGCGESAPAGISGEPSSETETEYKNFEGEGPVQGGIKSDEEIAALQEEEKMYEETSVSESEVESEESENESEDSETEYVDNTGHEPESYGSGNFQDYWMGDDYFDLEGYLRDNGAERIYGTNTDVSPNPAEDNITIYVGEFYNNKWELSIICDAGLTLAHTFVDEEGWIKKDPHYMLSCPIDELGNTVTVDSRGTTASYGVLIQMDAVVQYMKANVDSDDPLSGSGLHYTNNPL